MRTEVIARRRIYSRGLRRPALVRLAVSMVLVTGVMVTAAPPASATPVWSVTPSPSPPGPPSGALSGVTCLSETTCYAVGSYFAGAGDKTLVERWNGTSWSIIASPNPSGADGSRLSGVSCLNATTCYAVGSYSTSSGIKTLVERWNGTSWSILDSPNPAGPFAALIGVSCPIAGSCYAVGFSGFLDKTLVERWDGTSWSIVPSPNPSAADSIVLRDVACRNATRCFAVGDYYDGATNKNKTLAEHWNGTTWSIVASPNPSGADGSYLSGVTCPIGGSCFAVGDSSAGSVGKTLVEHWDGTSWSIVTSPNPSGATYSLLSGVSCPTETRCYAVGSSYSSSGVKTLVELWNGAIWSIVASPNGAADSYLIGVACSKTASCHSVGSSAGTTLVERWDGASWSIAGPPSGSSQSQLSNVTCLSTTNCYTVGSYFDGSRQKTLVEHWNGTTWSIVKSPSPGSFAALSDVACPSATSCYAVGSSSNGSADKTLVEHWDGTTWSIVASPNPSGPTDSTLSSVSCPSTTSCFAVGYYSDGSSSKTLVEHWNGTTWSIVASPNPSGPTDSTLNGVSCPSPTSCNAVGYYFEGFSIKTLVEHWNGTSWSIVASPNPSGPIAGLFGVSCPSTTSCWAVGVSGFFENTLVEHWNGTSWSIVASPNPGGTESIRLTDVSCPSPTSCYAVGDYFAGSKNRTLVERWNGTSWSIDPSPNPRGATDSFLSGVACPSPTSCYAVGDYFASVGDYTLVERYA